MAVAVLLAAEIARLTASSAFAEANPARALRFAPTAPAALISGAMTQVGQAAARGDNPDENTFKRLQDLAWLAPLQPEPFLVEAAVAEKAGRYDRAKQLLAEARLRAPRSAAARYLNADVAIRQGRILDGLREMAVLSRLLPATSIQLIPALALYARTPGSLEKLKVILSENPQLKRPLLNALAADSTNAALIISLAGPNPNSADRGTGEWQSRLLAGLIARGDLNQAYDLWHRFAGLPANVRPLLFDGDFEAAVAPRPFSWTFSSSSAGFAEADKGELRVIYYARDDATLASQLLVLPSGGEYSFEAPATGNAAQGALAWTLTCVGSGGMVMKLPLERPGVRFTIPRSDCPAQWLKLEGTAQEMPEDSDVQIGRALIRRINP